MSAPVKIGILGDFTPEYRSHQATNASLEHSAKRLKLDVEFEWLPTARMLERGAEKLLESFDGLWASSGSSCGASEGVMSGIQFARTCDWPFVGSCGGFHNTLLEYARNVIGIRDAGGLASESEPRNIVITPVSCDVPDRTPGAPKLADGGTIHIEPGTQLYRIYDRTEIHEEFFCRLEVNADFQESLLAAGVRVSGRGREEEIRAIELPGNRFYVAMLYQPQLSSTPARPHPVISAFLEAAAGFKESRTDYRSTAAY